MEDVEIHVETNLLITAQTDRHHCFKCYIVPQKTEGGQVHLNLVTVL